MIRRGDIPGRPSSIIVGDRKSKLGRNLIPWFTHARGEKGGSWMSHYAFLLSDGARVVEALAGGIDETSVSRFEESESYWGVLVEHVGVTSAAHTTMDGAALNMVGLPYNFTMILKQIPDGLLSKLLGRDVFFFRRLRVPWLRTTICSGLGIRIHAVGGYQFVAKKTVYKKRGRGWGMRLYAEQVVAPLPESRGAPDCIFDDVFELRPDAHIIRGEVNPDLRPEGLPDHVRAKIDRDLLYPPEARS